MKIQALLGINKFLSKSIMPTEASGLQMASVLLITQEGQGVYLNKQMEAAFEILQSDGSTRSTLSLLLSDAGSSPPTAPKDRDLLHKLAHPILYSILLLSPLGLERIVFSRFSFV